MLIKCKKSSSSLSRKYYTVATKKTAKRHAYRNLPPVVLSTICITAVSSNKRLDVTRRERSQPTTTTPSTGTCARVPSTNPSMPRFNWIAAFISRTHSAAVYCHNYLSISLKSPLKMHITADYAYCCRFSQVLACSRKGILPGKNWVVGCWCGYVSGLRCRFAYCLLQ